MLHPGRLHVNLFLCPFAICPLPIGDRRVLRRPCVVQMATSGVWGGEVFCVLQLTGVERGLDPTCCSLDYCLSINCSRLLQVIVQTNTSSSLQIEELRPNQKGSLRNVQRSQRTSAQSRGAKEGQ